ncbi:hypothetical protein QJ854_gp079 [Moumouvirus goulette]|uniref:Uncharacterized protein n=1 Tax=Moumouvirus goulette TaxID=1247379 RepID=M1PHX9_9VIRU|nr:hypothetical protein QJ854_gp079 [Moumouvirus goulette]AGF85703.1 hypothetical protein glt_00900 [Moumouvirus goulette]
MTANDEYLDNDLENPNMFDNYRVIKCTFWRKLCEIIWLICAIIVVALFIKLVYEIFKN